VFGDVRYPPGSTLGPRVQQDFQIVIIYEGEARIDIDGQELYVPGHHAALLLPARRERFLFATAAETRHTWCAVAPASVPPDLQSALRGVSACLPLTDRIHDLVEFGLMIPPIRLVSADNLLHAAGLMLLYAFVFEAELVHSPSTLPDALRRALAYMEAHLTQPLALPHISQAAMVTPQHLTRLFRRHIQTTPMRYLWQLRTRHGVELLGGTGLSIGEIAAQVGFQSPFHFSRLVQQYYQDSPRRLRERLWSGQRDTSD
jgi:AraC family transcriptional regulator of arabinose operon